MKEFKLPKEFATKWIETLRTTTEKQGRKGLLADDGYCCLGIACLVGGATPDDIYSKEGETVISDFSESKDKKYHFKISDKEFYDKIPPELKGACVNNILVSKLVELNDSGVPFKEIADWIEENVELY